jgi:cholesterol transport system auxiliary component
MRKAGMALMLAGLGGCVSLGGGKVPATLLTLSAEAAAPAGTTTAAAIAQAVLVMEPETDKRLAVLRVPVQVDTAQVAYLKDAQWVERPSRLFRSLLAETLRADGKRLVIEDDQRAMAAGERLSGRLLEMGYDAREMAVVVRFDAMLTRGSEVRTRRFEATVPGVAARPEEVGSALNKAANDVAGQVAEWMAG